MKSIDDSETTINLKLMIIITKLIKSIDMAITPQISSIGLTGTQFVVLEALLNKGPLTINEIIERTVSSSGNIGLVIKNLERSELIRKKINDKDRRSRTIELTEKGRGIISEFFPEHVKTINNIFSGMNEKEKIELTELIKGLSLSIGEQNDNKRS